MLLVLNRSHFMFHDVLQLIIPLNQLGINAWLFSSNLNPYYLTSLWCLITGLHIIQCLLIALSCREVLIWMDLFRLYISLTPLNFAKLNKLNFLLFLGNSLDTIYRQRRHWYRLGHKWIVRVHEKCIIRLRLMRKLKHFIMLQLQEHSLVYHMIAIIWTFVSLYTACFLR